MRISLLKTNDNDFSKPSPVGSNKHYGPALSPKSSCCHHGGASHDSSPRNVAYATRQILQLPLKEQISKPITAEIPNHASVFTNIGTTTKTVARLIEPSGTASHHQQPCHRLNPSLVSNHHVQFRT